MAVLHSGVCYGSASEAAHVFFSAIPPVVSGGSPVFVSSVELVSGVWTLVTREGGSVVASVAMPIPDFAQCDPAQLALDGMAAGWMVAGCWVAAWAVMLIKRSL